MAVAHLEVNGSLKNDDDAGFHIGMGFDAGLEGGRGWDFYAGVGLDNPCRFYNTSVDIITGEIVKAARQHLPPYLQPSVEYLELLLPITLGSAYDIGQMVALEAIGTGDESAAPFNKAFGERLLAYVLDKLAEAGELLLSKLLDQAITTVLEGQLDEAEQNQLKSKVEDLIRQMTDAEMSLETIVSIITPLMEIATILAPDKVNDWRRPLAITWTALSASYATRNAIATGGAKVSFLGFGASNSGDVLQLPADAPSEVVAEYASELGSASPHIEFDEAIDYLISVGIVPVLERTRPDLVRLLGTIVDCFELTPGDFVEAALQGLLGGNITQTDLYKKLKGFAQEGIDHFIMGEGGVIPTLENMLGDDQDARVYIKDVAKPCLLASSGFVFSQMDELVLHGNPLVVDSFRSGLSTLVYKIFARQTVRKTFLRPGWMVGNGCPGRSSGQPLSPD